MQLIIYFGTYGSTEEAAKKLAVELEASVLDGSKRHKVNINDYERVVFGYNIHAAKPNKSFIKYYKKFHRLYPNMPVAAFIVAADNNRKGEYLIQAEKLLPAGSRLAFVGGRLDSTHAKGLSKVIINNCLKAFISNDLELPKLDEEKLKDFAQELKEKEPQF